jgi:hypothetical protein
VTIDGLFFRDDIRYKGGPLSPPRMIHDFLVPYHRQLIANVKARQIDTSQVEPAQLPYPSEAIWCQKRVTVSAHHWV